jgi:hypothetical protein
MSVFLTLGKALKSTKKLINGLVISYFGSSSGSWLDVFTKVFVFCKIQNAYFQQFY